MKTVDPRISAHVKSQVTTLCTCWKLTRIDGEVYRWTDHDDDLTFQGEVYESAASGGFDRVALESAASLDVSNSEMVGFLGTGLTRDDLNAGLFDGAQLAVAMVNWADPTMGAITLRVGTLGEVTLADTDLYKVELRGLQQAYKQVLGEAYSPECRANFGDARCGIALSDYTALATVTAVTDRRHFVCQITQAMAKEAPSGMMNFGVVKFVDGENAGKTVEIKTYADEESEGVDENDDPVTITTATLELKFAVPNVITEGDTLEVIAGCDQKLETCKAYDNVVNFRGEPFTPGEKAVYRVIGGRSQPTSWTGGTPPFGLAPPAQEVPEPELPIPPFGFGGH